MNVDALYYLLDNATRAVTQKAVNEKDMRALVDIRHSLEDITRVSTVPEMRLRYAAMKYVVNCFYWSLMGVERWIIFDIKKVPAFMFNELPEEQRLALENLTRSLDHRYNTVRNLQIMN